MFRVRLQSSHQTLELIISDSRSRLGLNSGDRRIVAVDNIDNNPVVFPMLESRNHDDSHNALHSRNPDRNTTTVDSVLAPHISPVTQLEFGQEFLLVAGVLAMLEETACPESQDRVALPLHPDVVIRHGARAHGGLEQNMVGVCERDGEQCWLLWR